MKAVFNLFSLKKIFVSALFFAAIVGFSGCSDQTTAPSGTADSASQKPISIQDGTGVDTQMHVQDKNERVAFEFSGQKFSVMIPAGYHVADYSKIMNALRIYDEAQQSSLAFFVDELGDKSVAQLKDGMVKDGDTVKPWKDGGFEIDYAAKNISGRGLGTTLRTFLWADKKYAYKLQEQPKDSAQKELSVGMKALADSFQLGA